MKWVLRKTAGCLLLPVGIVLIPLPGPGWLVILTGLTLLGYGEHARSFGRGLRARVQRLAPRKPDPGIEPPSL